MGNAALSQLADDHDVPPEQLCHLAKKGMSPEAFLQEFKAQMDPDSGVEKQYYLSKNRLYVWRALRIVARTSLMVFCKSLGSTVAEKSTSEMYEKLVRDLDEQVPTAPPPPLWKWGFQRFFWGGGRGAVPPPPPPSRHNLVHIPLLPKGCRCRCTCCLPPSGTPGPPFVLAPPNP